MPLREGIRQEEALRYLECIEQQFKNLLRSYIADTENRDIHTILTSTKKLLGMILFGITDSEALSR